jgi:hypothetical protein
VFIAVIIETFAEIRVQFQNMYGTRGQETDFKQNQVFEKAINGVLKLITKDENKSQGYAPKICLRILRSSWFNMTSMSLVLVNAIITSTMKHSHYTPQTADELKFHYNIEVIFLRKFFSIPRIKIIVRCRQFSRCSLT